MAKTKEQKRKGRELRKRRLRHQQLMADRPRVFPEFSFPQSEADIAHVDPEFVAAVTETAKRLNFRDRALFDEVDVRFHRTMKSSGFNAAMAELEERVAGLDDDGQSNARKILYITMLKPGLAIFDILKRKGLLDRRVPYCDFQVRHVDVDFAITFDALLKTRTSHGAAHHSRRRPVMEIGGRLLTPAFTRHAVERAVQRLVMELDYMWAGDVFSFFSMNTHSEPVSLNGGRDAGFSMWAVCGGESCFTHEAYAKACLGDAYAEGRNYYYRIGYFPVAVDGEFACAKTCLTPGLVGTPEEELLRRSKISKTLEERLWAGVRNTETAKRLAETGDFSAIKWFHENGIPQVREFDQDVFNFSPRNNNTKVLP